MPSFFVHPNDILFIYFRRSNQVPPPSTSDHRAVPASFPATFIPSPHFILFAFLLSLIALFLSHLHPHSLRISFHSSDDTTRSQGPFLSYVLSSKPFSIHSSVFCNLQGCCIKVRLCVEYFVRQSNREHYFISFLRDFAQAPRDDKLAGDRPLLMIYGGSPPEERCPFRASVRRRASIIDSKPGDEHG